MPKYKTIEPVKYDRRKHIISFKYAVNGIKLAYATQPNFRVHIVAFILVNVASIIYNLSAIEYAAVILTSALVICMEMVNTVVEAVGDEITKGEYAKLIGVAKDVAAGGVLLSALCAVLVGLLIFIPKIMIQLDMVMSVI